MTRRAFRDVLFLLAAAVVHEFERDSCGHCCGDVRRREFVAAVAVSRHGLLRLPVTVKTRRVIGWNCFEGRGWWCVRVEPTTGWRSDRGCLCVADGAVIKVLRWQRVGQKF